MSNVIFTKLFDAKTTYDFIIDQRDRAWARYLHYQIHEPVMCAGWIGQWQRCNDAIRKIIKDYPQLEKLHEANQEQRKGRDD